MVINNHHLRRRSSVSTSPHHTSRLADRTVAAPHSARAIRRLVRRDGARERPPRPSHERLEKSAAHEEFPSPRARSSRTQTNFARRRGLTTAKLTRGCRRSPELTLAVALGSSQVGGRSRPRRAGERPRGPRDGGRARFAPPLARTRDGDAARDHQAHPTLPRVQRRRLQLPVPRCGGVLPHALPLRSHVRAARRIQGARADILLPDHRRAPDERHGRQVRARARRWRWEAAWRFPPRTAPPPPSPSSTPTTAPARSSCTSATASPAAPRCTPATFEPRDASERTRAPPHRPPGPSGELPPRHHLLRP